MPLLKYKCPVCAKEFEELVRSDEHVKCPNCDQEAQRLYQGKCSFGSLGSGKGSSGCSGSCAGCAGCRQ